MKIDVLTLFPDMFDTLNHSIIGRAIESGLISVNYTDIREYSQNKHRRVDDYPFGGGPGMVMKPEPIIRALKDVKQEDSRIIYLSPKGRVFNQSIAKELSKESHIVLLCGHYEGVDHRVVEHYVTDEISIGDYVLTGGELAAMVVIDSISRLVPGVLSSDESYMDESHYNGLLEYPQYTRPREYEGLKVPDVLLSGNHKKIDEWRKYQSLKTTYLSRPDLLDKKSLSQEEKQLLDRVISDIKK